MTQRDYEKLYTQGANKLKTSFFSFKFSPDYLGAVDNFTDAAKGFRKIGLASKAVVSFQKAIECNKHLNDSWSEGNCYLAIAEIYFFDAKKMDEGIENLKKASYCYQVAGKFNQSAKAFNSIADKFMENNEFNNAKRVLKEAFELCESNTEDKLIAGTFEPIYNKLLDVTCGLLQWGEAIDFTQKYINAMKKYPDNEKYRISKTYMKLCILRMINKEEYMCDDIFMKMINNNYEDTQSDIADVEKCLKAVKNLDKKSFNSCVSSSFILFENNLLKGLQNLYKEKEEANKNKGIQDNIQEDDNIINTNSKNNNIKDDEDDLK